MTTKRGTYRFTFTGRPSAFKTWLDDRFDDACSEGLTGQIIGNEGVGMIVLEGAPSQVDALADDIENDSMTTDFDTLSEEPDVTAMFSEFAEFAPSNACDRCS